MKKIIASLPIIIVFIATLSLLAFIGRAEAQRRYPQFQWEKMVAQAQVVEQPILQFLNAGLPLRQFGGFSAMGRSLLNSDPTVRALMVEDARQKTLFVEQQSGKASEELAGLKFLASTSAEPREPLMFEENREYYRLTVRARNKSTGPLSIGLRMTGKPYRYRYERQIGASPEWVEKSWLFKLDNGTGEHLGLFLVTCGVGTMDVATVRLEQ